MKPWEPTRGRRTELWAMGLLQSLGLARSAGDVAGLYTAIVRQARRVDFYASIGVPDTGGGRFDMVALHAYIVMRRLKELDGNAPRDLSQALFDYMFADMDRNLREMGVGDLGVGRQVKDMGKFFYGRINAYDAALAGPAAALDDALMRNVFADAPADAANVARLGRYIRSAVARSRDWTGADIAAARIAFPDPILD